MIYTILCYIFLVGISVVLVMYLYSFILPYILKPEIDANIASGILSLITVNFSFFKYDVAFRIKKFFESM